MHSDDSTYWATTGVFPQEIIVKLGTASSIPKIKTITTNGTTSEQHTHTNKHIQPPSSRVLPCGPMPHAMCVNSQNSRSRQVRQTTADLMGACLQHRYKQPCVCCSSKSPTTPQPTSTTHQPHTRNTEVPDADGRLQVVPNQTPRLSATYLRFKITSGWDDFATVHRIVVEGAPLGK